MPVIKKLSFAEYFVDIQLVRRALRRTRVCSAYSSQSLSVQTLERTLSAHKPRPPVGFQDLTFENFDRNLSRPEHMLTRGGGFTEDADRHFQVTKFKRESPFTSPKRVPNRDQTKYPPRRVLSARFQAQLV